MMESKDAASIHTALYEGDPDATGEDRSSIFSNLAVALTIFGIVLFVLACLRDIVTSLSDRNATHATTEIEHHDD